MSDHERIWLEPAPGADEEYGRQWVQHNVWPDGIEYIRADLAQAALEEAQHDAVAAETELRIARKQLAAPEAISDGETTVLLTEFRKFVDLIEGRAMACDGPVTPFLEELAASSDTDKDRFTSILRRLYAIPSPVPNVAGITINAEEVKALLYGVPKFEFSTALSRLASWLAEHDDETPTPPGNQIRTAECDGKDAVPVTGQLPVGTASPSVGLMGPTDSEMLDALASNYWNLRCIDAPTGGGDSDVDWVVTENQMGKPSEVEVARAYADDPRMAVRRALRSTDKSAARCVSCDEVLHDGDSVYYEHGEGGHIHSWCASEDPESFVDEDEVPLKAGEKIPKPFAYSVEKYEVQP